MGRSGSRVLNIAVSPVTRRPVIAPIDDGMPPEMAALLLLAGPESSSQKRDAIDGYLRTADFDWTSFVESALRHRLVPLLDWQVGAIAPRLFPAEIKDALRVHLEHNRRRSRILLEELHTVTTSLERAGIVALAIKGPVFAVQAYPDISLREYNDLDIFVDRNDYRTTVGCLKELGYIRDPALDHGKELLAWDYYGQDILFEPQLGIAVEPHWRLTPATFPGGLQFSDLRGNATRYAIDGHSFVSLSPEDTLLAVCIHHGKEQWCWLRQVCDVAYFVHRNGDFDWRRVLQIATEHACLRALLLGLCLGRRLLSIDLPEMLVAQIEKDGEVGRLADSAVSSLLYRQSDPPRLDAVSGFRRKLQDSRSRQISYVCRTLLMPSNIHFRMIRLPRPLEFLYYPAKWWHDYLLLPVWNLCKRVFALRTSGVNGPACD